MNAAILNPGPSLADFRPRDIDNAFDLIIGVNRAALLHPVDVWCCCDLPAIESWHEKVIGSPLLVAGMEAIDNLRDRKVVWRGEVFDRREMLSYCPHAMDWVMFSFTTALIYAAYRGATQIDIYGADWSGTLDVDGVAAGKNRSTDRWALERGLFHRLTEWMKPKGITVTRHTSEDKSPDPEPTLYEKRAADEWDNELSAEQRAVMGPTRERYIFYRAMALKNRSQ